jgi:DNA-binding NarL/FixJ family response regulator
VNAAGDQTTTSPVRARVLILHRHLLVGEAFAAALDAMAPDLQVRATTDPRDALRNDGSTDVLLAEQRLVPPGLRWHQFGKADGAPLYIALGESDAGPAVTASVAAIRAGARAWVPPDVPPSRLLEVIDIVLDGQMWLPPPQLGRVMEELTRARSSPDETLGLTARERTILELIAAGRSTREIARLLLLSPNTVRTHRQHLFSKLGVHSAVEAAAWLRSVNEREHV